MSRKISTNEWLILFTAIGLVATFAAPWVELRGTYAAWRIVEWHTFWRGQDAFQLASVVAADYRVPIEYATTEMQSTARNLSNLGLALAGWYIATLILLLVVGFRWRVQTGGKPTRIALEIIAMVAVNAIVIYLLAMFLALPSTLTPKVDFRTTEDIHTSSLVWSSVNILPVAPVLAILAVIGQVVVLATLVKKKHR